MPKFESLQICPPVFVDVDPDNSIYKVRCRCADYDPNTNKFTSDFVKAPVGKCDRAYGITAEDFLGKFEPDMMDLHLWYADLKNKQDVVTKLIKDGKIRKAKRLLKRKKQ